MGGAPKTFYLKGGVLSQKERKKFRECMLEHPKRRCVLILSNTAILEKLRKTWKIPLHKMPEFHLICWCRNFVKSLSLRIVSKCSMQNTQLCSFGTCEKKWLSNSSFLEFFWLIWLFEFNEIYLLLIWKFSFNLWHKKRQPPEVFCKIRCS